MILKKYFLKKFGSFFILSTGGLTLLHVTIEFFEKLIRAHSFVNVAKFALLNTIPTFFDLLPLGTFLATLLLLRDIFLNKDIETLEVIGIKESSLYKMAAIAGLFLTLSSFAFKEIVIFPLFKRAENYKFENFKNSVNKKIENRWFSVSQTLFHIKSLNLATLEGIDLTIIKLKDNSLDEKVCAKVWTINSDTKEIFIKTGEKLLADTNRTIKIDGFKIVAEELCSQLKLNSTDSILSNLNTVLLEKERLPKNLYAQEVITITKRLLAPLQPLIYLLLTFILFFITRSFLISFLVFPGFVTLTTLFDFLTSHGFNFALLFVPYVIAFILLFLLIKLKLQQAFLN